MIHGDPQREYLEKVMGSAMKVRVYTKGRGKEIDEAKVRVQAATDVLENGGATTAEVRCVLLESLVDKYRVLVDRYEA